MQRGVRNLISVEINDHPLTRHYAETQYEGISALTTSTVIGINAPSAVGMRMSRVAVL